MGNQHRNHKNNIKHEYVQRLPIFYNMPINVLSLTKQEKLNMKIIISCEQILDLHAWTEKIYQKRGMYICKKLGEDYYKKCRAKITF